jgi:MFS transporter, DHA2 family, multidrug resistance protein
VDPDLVQRRRWLILGIVVICLLVVVLDTTILNVALPSISRELGASQGQLTGAILSYSVVFSSLLITGGLLGDRYGRQKVLIAGLIIFGIFSALCAKASTPNELIVLRGFMGIGAAMVPPQTLSIVSATFKPSERGRAIGIWAGATGVAIALGPITGGFLLDHFWWGSIFLVNVPFVIVGVVMVALFVPDSKAPDTRRIDPIGVVLSIVGLGTFVFGIIYAGDYREWTSFWSLGMMLIGVVTIVGFVLYEKHSDHPSFDVRVFESPRFSAASVAMAMAFLALFGVTFFLTFYYQFVRGLSPFQAGLMVLPVAIGQLIFAPQSPKVVAKIGPKFTIGGALVIVAIAFVGYLFIAINTPLWFFVVVLTLTGFGLANIIAPGTESVVSSLPPRMIGVGSGVNNTTRQIGGAFGIAVLGTVLELGYSSAIQPSLSVLPADLQTKASRSIGDTYDAMSQYAQTNPVKGAQAFVQLGCHAPKPGQQGYSLYQAAVAGGRQVTFRCDTGTALIHGIHFAAIGSIAAALIGAVVCFIYLPRRADAKAYETGPTSADAPATRS